MRIKITLIPKENISYNEIQQYFIQGFIWNIIKNSEFSAYHDIPHFKYFCFSEIFPPTNFKTNESKNFIISSPNKFFIKLLYFKIKEIDYIKLGQYVFDYEISKPFDIKFKRYWITGSPIVVQVDRNVYWSKKYHSLNIFLKRLKENAIKKYNLFYNEKITFEGDIFDSLKFKKQVAVHLKKGGIDARIIGTKWIFEKNEYPKKLRKFYKFILDCGLGEKNSIGFGFLNPVKFK